MDDYAFDMLEHRLNRILELLEEIAGALKSIYVNTSREEMR